MGPKWLTTLLNPGELKELAHCLENVGYNLVFLLQTSLNMTLIYDHEYGLPIKSLWHRARQTKDIPTQHISNFSPRDYHKPI